MSIRSCPSKTKHKSLLHASKPDFTSSLGSNFLCATHIIPVKNEEGVVMMFILNFDYILDEGSSDSLERLNHTSPSKADQCEYPLQKLKTKPPKTFLQPQTKKGWRKGVWWKTDGPGLLISQQYHIIKSILLEKKQVISVETAMIWLLINWEHYNAFFTI